MLNTNSLSTPDLIMIGVIVVLVVAAIVFGVWLRGNLRTQRTLEAWEEQERLNAEVAPELRMQSAKWRGPVGGPEEMSEHELAQKIKAGLEARKLGGNKR